MTAAPTLRRVQTGGAELLRYRRGRFEACVIAQCVSASRKIVRVKLAAFGYDDDPLREGISNSCYFNGGGVIGGGTNGAVEATAAENDS